MRGIKSKNDKLGTYENNISSQFCFDDHLYILKNEDDTLVYGHKDIVKKIVLI